MWTQSHQGLCEITKVHISPAAPSLEEQQLLNKYLLTELFISLTIVSANMPEDRNHDLVTQCKGYPGHMLSDQYMSTEETTLSSVDWID